MAAKSDLQRAYEALAAKQATYTELWKYYDGEQELRYINQRLAQVFKSLDARFTQNWAAVVIDSELERISLRSFTVTDNTSVSDQLNDLWERTEMNLDADDVHLAAAVCGEAFVFVWREQGEATEAYYNDPRLCHAFYESENPRRMRFAAKWWVGDEDEKRYLNLYYPDRIEYYVSTQKAASVRSYKAFEQVDGAPNPYGVIPIFHFRPERRRIKSRLANVIEPQDAINKLTADMMVSAEFGAMMQRWMVTDANIDTLKSSPGEVWKIPASDGQTESTQVGEFAAAELANFINAIDKLAYNIGIISRTPKHFFFAQGGEPSGEALIAMEAPLNKKAGKFIDRLKPVWAQVAEFMLRLENVSFEAGQVAAQFDRPETVQPRTEAEIREINNRAGLPLKTTLRWEGKTEAEITTIEQEIAEEREAAQATLAEAMLRQQRNFDQGDGAPPPKDNADAA